jgi:hypothetical protein
VSFTDRNSRLDWQDRQDDLDIFRFRAWRGAIASASDIEGKLETFEDACADIAAQVSEGRFFKPDGVDELLAMANAHGVTEAITLLEVERIIGVVFTRVEKDKQAEQDKASQTEKPAGLGEWDAGDDIEPPPPRGWLLGNIFCRKFLSSLLGDGGVGKTALRYAQYLSLAINRSLTGDHVFQRCRVLIVSLEDNDKELRRRILAARLHHKVTREDVKGWLFLSTPGNAGGKLAALNRAGQLLRGDLAANLEAVITARKIDLVALDPFVKTHSVEENNNSAIDDVAQILTDLAAKYDIAVDVLHHTSKGTADPGNASRGRGASSMTNAARLVYTLSTMSPDDAKTFGIAEGERRSFVRMDSGKVNITPPLSAAKWFRLVSVSLGNATKMYPHGDEVQTVERWTPPEIWDDLSADLLNGILAAIDTGLSDGNRYSDAPSAGDRAAWKVVCEHAPQKTEKQAREIIKTWVKNEWLIVRQYENPVTRKEVNGLYRNPEKKPS